MTQQTKKLLDYLPSIALILSAIVLLMERFSGGVLLQVRHIVGLILLPISFACFFIRHKLGVLATGLVILLGLFGALSFSPAIGTMTFGKTFGDGEHLPLLYFQPIFLVWLTLHLILSGRYYTGIASKRYWQQIDSDEPLRIGEP